MTRDLAVSATPARCLLVWLVVTVGAMATMSTAGGAAATLLTPAPWHDTFEGLLVSVAAAAVLACASWLWLVTTLTVLELAAGRPRHRTVGGTRRLVLIACGAAVVAGLGSPAVAGSGTAGGAREDLVGLPLPDRAVAAVVPVRPRPARQPPGAVVATPVAPEPPPHVVIVRPGDSLWSIAAASLPPRATPAEVDGAWRALYAANRAAIGADPDLVLPGTELVVHPALDPEPRKARP